MIAREHTMRQDIVSGDLQRAQMSFQAADYEAARRAAEQALAVDPRNADAFHMLGAIALKRSDLDEAEVQIEKALRGNRRSPYILNTLGHLRCARGQYEAAEEAYRQAIRIEPRLWEACAGLGKTLLRRGEVQAAVTYLRRYLERRPNDPDARHEIAAAYRSLDTKEAWREWLSLTPGLPDPDGAPFDGKRIVIHPDEGVGDEIMFASLLGELASNEITLQCDRRLEALFRRSFPSIHVIGTERTAMKLVVGAVRPGEIHLPASALPAYFRLSQPQPGGFLRADPEQVSEWRRRYELLGPGMKVGISWRGGVDPADSARRSLALSQWGAVLATPDLRFINLQYGDVSELAGTSVHHWDDADPLTDLDFFAAQIAALDLVVSVSNTTVHMAGALGVRTWALIASPPSWRWGMAGEKTSWYESVTLLRQREAGDWNELLQRVRTRLHEMRAQ